MSRLLPCRLLRSALLNRSFSTSSKQFLLSKAPTGFHPFTQYACRNINQLRNANATRFYSAETATKDDDSPTVEVKKFRAETKKLLDIVAKSLYSDKEVFIRELISNASDAIERLRFQQTSSGILIGSEQKPCEIHIRTDDTKNLLIIQDSGIGMTREEMEDNLGTIARSGSREFLSGLNEANQSGCATDIIGQFGVGFYASFMVADKVDVYSRRFSSTVKGSDIGPGFRWSSSGQNGEYEISPFEDVDVGTKVVLHLKQSASEFARDEVVERILKKYSNFVGSPVFLNGRHINVLEPTWTKESSKVTEEEHTNFYHFLCGNTYDTPRYTLMYRTDAPINLRVLLYIPNIKPSIFDVAREGDSGVALYSRKVLIMNRTDALLPKWLRFFKGVVDSEDIPLNLSRELLQDNALIERIKRLLTARAIRFLAQQCGKDKSKFRTFLNDYGFYLKEGIITEPEQEIRESVSQLLRWESSALPAGDTTSLGEYASRMRAGTRSIYFLSAPSRQLAESSPYLEAVRKKYPDTEVLFLYEPYDELVLMQLHQFDKKNLLSIETLIAEDAADTDTVGPERPGCLSQEDATRLVEWAEKMLGPKVKKVKITQRLTNHPCFVSVREAGAMRHFLRTTMADRPAEERFRVMEPILELNPENRTVRFLCDLITETMSEETEKLASSLLDQLYDNAMAQAGLLDDVRGLASRMNDLIAKLVDSKCKIQTES